MSAARALAVVAALLVGGCDLPERTRASSTRTSDPVPPALSGDVPALDAPRLRESERVTIDGRLDEPAWASAAATGPFVDPTTGKAASGDVRGRARLAWDADHLYVAFEVEDAALRGGFPADAIDPHLWERDTVELMLDPDGDGDNRDYYELQVSPQGLVFDSRFDEYNRPRGGPDGPFGHQDWSSGVERAVALRGTIDRDDDRDDGYVVELRVPWRAFDRARRAPPSAGDTWRINLYAMQDNGGVAWSPILGKGNFHRASRFGCVRFVDAAR